MAGVLRQALWGWPGRACSSFAIGSATLLVHLGQWGLGGGMGSWVGRSAAERGGVGCACMRGETRFSPAPHTRARSRATSHRKAQPHVEMILPQVHLRKPCYDFTFL